MDIRRAGFLIALVTGTVPLSGVAQGETEPPQFSLGPYLQFLTPDSAALFWETHQPVTAVVEYGKTEKLSGRIEATESKTRHHVIVKRLEPGTKYSYRIKALADKDERISKVYKFDTAFNYTVPPVAQTGSPYPDDAAAKLYADAAQRIISQTHVTKGYCLVYGCGKGQLAYELAKRSELMIVGVDEDTDKVTEARKLLGKAGVYGTRITIRHVASLSKLPITRYFANLIVSDRIVTDGTCPGTAAEMFRVLRPGGGAVCLGQPAGAPNRMEKSILESRLKDAKLKWTFSDAGGGVWAYAVRPALAHAGTWTHQYASPDNATNDGGTLNGATGVGDMEVQWIGRPGADFGIDRNPRMPTPLSVNGRLFHQGMNRLIALDSYNGAILWTLEIPDLRRVNIPRDASNWCADEEHLYVVVKDTCWVLDAYTGKLAGTHALPKSDQAETHEWGYVARVGNKLYGSIMKKGSAYTAYWGNAMWYDGGRKGPADATTFKVCSHSLFAYADDTGKPVWTYANGVIINSSITIGGSRVYFVESRHPEPKAEETGRIRSRKLWSDQYLVALDAETGSKLWEQPIDTADGNVVFFSVYAGETLIIASSTTGKYHVYAYDATNGNAQWEVNHKWTSDNHGGHMQHPVVVGNTVFLEPCGYDLKTGKRVTDKMGRREGCSTYAGTGGVLIHRGKGRCIAMWDIETGKASSWRNLRPSCWLSVIPAGGMVLAPEGGGGCACGNWLETSLGFVPKANRNDR